MTLLHHLMRLQRIPLYFGYEHVITWMQNHSTIVMTPQNMYVSFTGYSQCEFNYAMLSSYLLHACLLQNCTLTCELDFYFMVLNMIIYHVCRRIILSFQCVLSPLVLCCFLLCDFFQVLCLSCQVSKDYCWSIP